MVGRTGAERREIGIDDLWQQSGANSAMWRVKRSANRRSKTVHSAESCIRERESAQQTGEAHVLASANIVTLLDRPL